MGTVRVRVWRRRKREDGEERERGEKNGLNRTFSFYIACKPGRFKTDPSSLACGR